MGLAFLHLLSSSACVTFGSHSPAGTDSALGPCCSPLGDPSGTREGDETAVPVRLELRHLHWALFILIKCFAKWARVGSLCS